MRRSSAQMSVMEAVRNEQARIEPVGVRLTVSVGLNSAFTDFRAFSEKIGLEFGPGHGVHSPSFIAGSRLIQPTRSNGLVTSPTPRPSTRVRCRSHN